MSLSLSRQRVRISLNPLSHDGFTCRLQLATAKIWRGTDVAIEVGMYYGATFVDSVSGITSLHLDILPSSDRDATPLLQKSSAPSTISAEEWVANTDAKYHGRFILNHTDTQFDMAAATDNLLSLWCVFHALMADGSYITLGAGQILIEEDGAQNNLTAPGGSTPAFRISDGELQLWNPDTSTWHTLYVTGAAGAETLAIGPGEA